MILSVTVRYEPDPPRGWSWFAHWSQATPAGTVEKKQRLRCRHSGFWEAAQKEAASLLGVSRKTVLVERPCRGEFRRRD